MQQPQERQECMLCGKTIKNDQQVEIIGVKEENKLFDSIDCALIFRKFESVYRSNNGDLFPFTRN